MKEAKERLEDGTNILEGSKLDYICQIIHFILDQATKYCGLDSTIEISKFVIAE